MCRGSNALDNWLSNVRWQRVPENTQQSFEGSDGNIGCEKGFGQKASTGTSLNGSKGQLENVTW